MMLPLKVESLGLYEAIGIAVLGFVIVLIVLAFLMLFVKLLSKIISGASEKASGEKKEEKASVNEAPVPVTPAVSAVKAPETAPAPIANTVAEELPYTPGYVTLDGVSEQDAAVIMAITSHKTGIGLERLCFKSIKRLNQEPTFENIEEQDAAVIMAITADKLGIPFENLCFNSIKLVEE